jgi:hypothetical protein
MPGRHAHRTQAGRPSPDPRPPKPAPCLELAARVAHVALKHLPRAAARRLADRQRVDVSVVAALGAQGQVALKRHQRLALRARGVCVVFWRGGMQPLSPQASQEATAAARRLREGRS